MLLPKQERSHMRDCLPSTNFWNFCMNTRTLLVFATESEAAAARRALPPHHDICITGMGPKAITENLPRQLNSYDTIINAGIVGSMRDDIAIGTLVPIGRIHYEGIDEVIDVASTGYSLLTVDAPLYVKKPAYDLVDMEGYMIAHVCKQANKKLHFIKVVSDVVSEHSSLHIKQRLPELAELLASLVHERVQKLQT